MSKKIGYLGAGTWGSALAALLANAGHKVSVWDYNLELLSILDKDRKHPKLKEFEIPSSIRYEKDLQAAIEGVDLVVESVTSAGVRPVFEKVRKFDKGRVPIILTSKGIEQNSNLLLPEVILDILGEESRNRVGCISGPSHAEEVAKNLPTSLVCSAYDANLRQTLVEIFTTPTFRVYPNSDIQGVSFGGAMKNIIAIACGISKGLGFGDNAMAALITRGLHEMKKLCPIKGGRPETLYGLAGLGDLCVTCLSILSRNFRFGRLIALGNSEEEARKKIGMAVEGAYTCLSAVQLGKKHNIPLPITEGVYTILYERKSAVNVVKELLQRPIKEEWL